MVNEDGVFEERSKGGLPFLPPHESFIWSEQDIYRAFLGFWQELIAKSLANQYKSGTITSMLKISKLADYATVIMNHLALHPNDMFSAVEMAKQLYIPMPTVSKLLKQLLAAHLVSSTRGAEGGYRLARPAQQIPIIEVIAAIDGQLALTECSMHGKICMQDSVCAIRNNWRLVNQMIVSFLQNLTLADMSVPLQRHPTFAEKILETVT